MRTGLIQRRLNACADHRPARAGSADRHVRPELKCRGATIPTWTALALDRLEQSHVLAMIDRLTDGKLLPAEVETIMRRRTGYRCSWKSHQGSLGIWANRGNGRSLRSARPAAPLAFQQRRTTACWRGSTPPPRRSPSLGPLLEESPPATGCRRRFTARRSRTLNQLSKAELIFARNCTEAAYIFRCACRMLLVSLLLTRRHRWPYRSRIAEPCSTVETLTRTSRPSLWASGARWRHCLWPEGGRRFGRVPRTRRRSRTTPKH